MKRISEMTQEEQQTQRSEWQTRQKKSRETKLLTGSLNLDDLDEWIDKFIATAGYRELSQLSKEFSKQVLAELGQENSPEVQGTLTQVSIVLNALNRDLIKKITTPSGKAEIIGYLFADVIGLDLVIATHKHQLERSATFSAAYRELLRLLHERYRKNLESADPIERENAIAVNRELKGTFPKPAECAELQEHLEESK